MKQDEAVMELQQTFRADGALGRRRAMAQQMDAMLGQEFGCLVNGRCERLAAQVLSRASGRNGTG